MIMTLGDMRSFGLLLEILTSEFWVNNKMGLLLFGIRVPLVIYESANLFFKRTQHFSVVQLKMSVWWGTYYNPVNSAFVDYPYFILYCFAEIYAASSRVLTLASLQRLKMPTLTPAPADCEVWSVISYSMHRTQRRSKFIKLDSESS